MALAGAALIVPIAACAGADVNWVTAANAHHVPANPYRGPHSSLGATGVTPHDSQLSAQLQHDAGDQSALLDGAGPMANLPSGPLGIPGIVLQAYLKAQQTLAVQEPGCRLPWWLLAGIGQVESSQAEHGEVDAQGNTLRPILGPELNGSNGTAAIPAYDGGKWTGDPNWDRAVGPMQFLSSTWLEWGQGGNPNNVFDAALAAGRYLCAGGRDLSDPAQRAQAVFSYNHSDSYVRLVLIWANAFSQGVQPLPETPVLAAAVNPGGSPSVPGAPLTPGGTTPPGSTTPGGGGTPPASSTRPTTSSNPPTTPKPTTTTTAPPTTTTTPTCPAPPTTTSPTTTSTPPPTTTPVPPGCPAPPTTTTTAPATSTTKS